MRKPRVQALPYVILLVCAIGMGAYLRLHMLRSQILLDDEWHGINEVIGKSVWELFTQFNPDYTSPPLNIYNLFVSRGPGWSEFALRLPMLAAGILGLVLLPLLVKRVLDKRASIVFAFLLAISPFLIFYSRYSRSYGLTALLSFAALLAAYRWLTTGKAGYAAGFVLIGVSAVYLHPFSAIAVFMPPVTAVGIYAADRLRPSSSKRLGLIAPQKAVYIVSLAMLAFSALLLWPFLLNAGKLPWAKGEVTMNGLMTAATLASGTADILLNVIFYSAAIAGAVLLLKQRPLLGRIFLLTVCAHIGALLAVRPTGIESGAVFLRYMIVSAPIILTMAAASAGRLLEKAQTMGGARRAAAFLCTALFLGLLYAAGPLPGIYTQPNDFTDHSAFQGSYTPMTWERSEAHHYYPDLSVGSSEIPPFYHQVRREAGIGTIIEYPFDICNYNSLLYYYQHFHKKRVLAGYSSDPAILGYEPAVPQDDPRGTFTIGMLSADQILCRETDKKKLSFRNMVDITDIDALLKSRAGAIVLHKYIMALRLLPDGMDRVRVYYRSARLLKERFEKVFGPAIYEDEEIVCFRIGGR